MTTAQILDMEKVTKGRRLTGLTDLTKDLAGERFLAHRFPGMIVVMEIVKVTPRTVSLRRTKTGDRRWVAEHNHNDVYSEAIPSDDDSDQIITRRISSQYGSLRVGNYANAGTYFIPDSIDGVPLSMANFAEY